MRSIYVMHAPLNQNEGIGKLNVFLTTRLKQKNRNLNRDLRALKLADCQP